MKIEDLELLKIDIDQEGLYNFFVPTYQFTREFSFEQFIVGKEQEGRIDLVSNEIFETVDMVGFLLNLNNIDNPLNIMEGDQLIYTGESSADFFRVDVSNTENIASQLVNQDKSQRKDSNRQKFVENNFSLQSNIKKSPTPAVNIENNQIILG